MEEKWVDSNSLAKLESYPRGSKKCRYDLDIKPTIGRPRFWQVKNVVWSVSFSNLIPTEFLRSLIKHLKTFVDSLADCNGFAGSFLILSGAPCPHMR